MPARVCVSVCVDAFTHRTAVRIVSKDTVLDGEVRTECMDGAALRERVSGIIGLQTIRVIYRTTRITRRRRRRTVRIAAAKRLVKGRVVAVALGERRFAARVPPILVDTGRQKRGHVRPKHGANRAHSRTIRKDGTSSGIETQGHILGEHAVVYARVRGTPVHIHCSTDGSRVREEGRGTNLHIGRILRVDCPAHDLIGVESLHCIMFTI